MIKVIPKNKSQWKNYKTVCLGISMHTPNHEGQALEGLIRWADDSFEDIMLDVSDTLHRHNYIAQGFTAENALAQARDDGNQWLARNRHVIDSCRHRTRIVRWDHWLEHPDFEPVLARFRAAFEEQPLFRDSVVADAQTFYKRRFLSLSGIPERVLRCSIDYLLEEISIHSIMYAENECAVLYPGKQHGCYKLVRDGKVANVPEGLNNSSFTRMVVYNFTERQKSA